jgi:hypothetical protein
MKCHISLLLNRKTKTSPPNLNALQLEFEKGSEFYPLSIIKNRWSISYRRGIQKTYLVHPLLVPFALYPDNPRQSISR